MAQSRSPRKSIPAAIGGAALLLIGGYLGVDLATDSEAEPTSDTGLSACHLSSLPAEAEETTDDILAGGPFDFPNNDNVHFGNYEGSLPEQARDYYREFTVETPGLSHRGTKRIVIGGGTATDPEVWYYTDDHYGTFCAIPDAEQ